MVKAFLLHICGKEVDFRTNASASTNCFHSDTPVIHNNKWFITPTRLHLAFQMLCSVTSSLVPTGEITEDGLAKKRAARWNLVNPTLATHSLAGNLCSSGELMCPEPEFVELTKTLNISANRRLYYPNPHPEARTDRPPYNYPTAHSSMVRRPQ